jgi:hypothetical protein
MKKDLVALVNAASKKISAKKKRKNVQSPEHLIAGSAPGSSSGPVVDLEGEEPSEELVQDSAKKQRLMMPFEDPLTPIKAVPVLSKRGDFLQLPKLWSEPELCGPQSTLFLDDPELKIIQDLGPAGRSKAITDGVIATMKALEVTAALNNASLEVEVWVDALVRERDALTARVTALEEDQRSKRSVAEECDRQLASFKEQLFGAQTALEQATLSSRKLAEEKVSLEEALKKADLPGEDEAENLVDRIGELEGSLVDAVKLGFDRAVAQLKVVNPGIELNVDGIHPLSEVEDGVITPPPDPEEDNGHVEAHA